MLVRIPAGEAPRQASLRHPRMVKMATEQSNTMRRGDYSHSRRQIPEKTLANRIKRAHGRLMSSQSSGSGAVFGNASGHDHALAMPNE